MLKNVEVRSRIAGLRRASHLITIHNVRSRIDELVALQLRRVGLQVLEGGQEGGALLVRHRVDETLVNDHQREFVDRLGPSNDAVL